MRVSSPIFVSGYRFPPAPPHPEVYAPEWRIVPWRGDGYAQSPNKRGHRREMNRRVRTPA
ncbi:protein of unknown function [Azospirillum lipoferum 4B]|uniref:Uncharacterized protein n=1 Tax=Azospirillum lipoferum (strain 4B) TaxID=862719 RepID=G7Z8E4_AZOL4|nr:protein of unknown function [Azospirillum lipoferum 4B]